MHTGKKWIALRLEEEFCQLHTIEFLEVMNGESSTQRTLSLGLGKQKY